MTVTVEQALAASITLDAGNTGHACILNRIMVRSAVRGDVAIVDGSLSTAPDTHKAVARVMLDSLHVEFLGMTGEHSRWAAEEGCDGEDEPDSYYESADAKFGYPA